MEPDVQQNTLCRPRYELKAQGRIGELGSVQQAILPRRR